LKCPYCGYTINNPYKEELKYGDWIPIEDEHPVPEGPPPRVIVEKQQPKPEPPPDRLQVEGGNPKKFKSALPPNEVLKEGERSRHKYQPRPNKVWASDLIFPLDPRPCTHGKQPPAFLDTVYSNGCCLGFKRASWLKRLLARIVVADLLNSGILRIQFFGSTGDSGELTCVDADTSQIAYWLLKSVGYDPDGPIDILRLQGVPDDKHI
jgi:hypothetical protein